MDAPVTATDFSEARKEIISAISLGATQREKSAFGMSSRFLGVSIVPGRTQLTRIPLLFNSADILSVKRITALFEAE